MKKIGLLIFLILATSLILAFRNQGQTDFSSLHSEGLNNSDSLLAKEYQAKGKSFVANRQFDSAAHCFSKGLSTFQALKMWDNYQAIGTDLVLAMIYMRKLDSANSINASVRKAFETQLTSDTATYKRLMNMQGAIFSLTGKLDSGIIVMEKLLWLDKKYFKDSLTMVMAGTYNNLGTLYTDYQVYDKALKYYDSAAFIHQKLVGDTSEHAARMYSNKAIALKAMGNINQSLENNRRSNEVFKKLLPKDHPRLALALLNIANDLLDLVDSQKDVLEAQGYIENANQILSRGGNGEHTFKIDCFRFSAKANKHLNNLDLALGQFEKAIKLESSIYGAGHPDIAKIMLENIEVLILKEEFELAKDQLNKALLIYEKAVGENYSGIAKIYLLKAEIEEALRHKEEALVLYQNAIQHLIPTTGSINKLANPTMVDLVVNQDLFVALKNKARLTGELFNQQNDVKYLNASLDTYDLLTDYIKLTRKGFFGTFAKLKFNEQQDKIYEEGIKTAIQLFEQTKNENYLFKAVQFSDDYKSGILLEEIQSTQSKMFANIPNELIVEESSLRASINLYKKELFNHQSEKNIDDNLVKTLEEKLFALNARLELLSNRMKNSFSAYHQLRYENKQFDIASFQKTILQPDQLLIQYFIGARSLYVFCIGQNYVSYLVKPIDASLNTDISTLVNAIKIKSQNVFSEKAYHLYEYLLSATLAQAKETNADINHLIIIPDGMLGYIPFETLLIQKPKPNEGYKSLAYLIKNYQITNHYSANLMALQQEKIGNRKGKNSFLGFAPTFIDKSSQQFLALNERTRAFMDTLVALPDAKTEVQEIAELLNGVSNVGIDATESKFKKIAGDYNILHLASHSIIEDEKPLYSRLLFDNESDSVEDGFLHTYELYNMQLNAELVCLSACNTGIGKLYKGEGIASLARGFMYAGVPNLVMSLWSVSDKPTKDLMIYFYKGLKSGKTKSAALRQAKLRYLEQADDVTANPYYWGAFIYLGQPEQEPRPSWWWAWLLAIAATLAFVFYILNKSKYAKP